MISILSADVDQSPRYELPGIAGFLSQGAFVGALLGFTLPVNGMLSDPENGYNFLLIAWLPYFLAGGMVFGLLVAVFIWAFTFLIGHRLIFRVPIGIVVFLTFLIAFIWVWVEPRPSENALSATDYLYFLRIYGAVGAVFGLVVGSRLRPGYELVRGITTERWPVMNAMTGLILRILIPLATMYSILILIWTFQHGRHHSTLVMTVIAVAHLIAAVMVVFTRMPFWLLLLLALIINFPVAVCITDVLTEKQTWERFFILVYLHLWAAFLCCRVSVPHKEQGNENRNYWRYWFRRQSSDNSAR